MGDGGGHPELTLLNDIKREKPSYFFTSVTAMYGSPRCAT